VVGRWWTWDDEEEESIGTLRGEKAGDKGWGLLSAWRSGTDGV